MTPNETRRAGGPQLKTNKPSVRRACVRYGEGGIRSGVLQFAAPQMHFLLDLVARSGFEEHSIQDRSVPIGDDSALAVGDISGDINSLIDVAILPCSSAPVNETISVVAASEPRQL